MAETSDVSPDDVNGSAAVQIEPSSDGDMPFLDEMDSFWEEVKAGLYVSRFVTDAVMKEILTDVQQQAVRQMACKDAEIASLNHKLQQLEHGSLILPEGRDKRYDEFYNLRQQVDSISKSLLNSGWGLSGSQHNSEGSEDMSKQRGKEQSSRDGIAKENGSKDSEEEVFDDPQFLKQLDKHGVIAHFNKVMNQMKRQHDSAVQQKTEEIFELKRKLMNEGPNSWHLRNNKELEQMSKKIEEAISKLDVLLLENKRAFLFPSQQDKSNVADSDIQQLQGGETNNEEGPCSTPSKALYFASIGADHENHLRRLESDIEDASIATIIKEEIEKIVVKEYVSEIKIGLHDYEMELNMKQEVCSIIQNEAIAVAMSSIDLSLLNNNEEKGCAEAESQLKQKIDKLNLVVDSFTEVVREKEEFVSQIGLEAMEAHVDSLCHELDVLRDKVGKQDSYISEKGREFDIIVCRLKQAQEQVQHNNVTLSELNDRFRTVSDSLKVSEKQNQVLHALLEEKEKTLTSAVSKDSEFKECMKQIVESIRDFEKFLADEQTIVANKVQHSESRIFLLKEQFKHLAREGNLLRKKALRYKEISETRGSNLQKAELEVDLLGHEVEALTDLLAKIYIALDHYSPVLQHYTGVMETLNMIKKHISMAK